MVKRKLCFRPALSLLNSYARLKLIVRLLAACVIDYITASLERLSGFTLDLLKQPCVTSDLFICAKMLMDLKLHYQIYSDEISAVTFK